MRKAFYNSAPIPIVTAVTNVSNVTPNKNFNRASTTFNFVTSVALANKSLVLIELDSAFSS